MTMSVDLIKHAMLQHPNDPDAAASLVVKYATIRQNVENRRATIKSIRAKAEESVRKLEGQVLCEHELRMYHGDPSGGSDSSEECIVCGELLCRKTVRFT